jgi:hypothetical protein
LKRIDFVRHLEALISSVPFDGERKATRTTTQAREMSGPGQACQNGAGVRRRDAHQRVPDRPRIAAKLPAARCAAQSRMPLLQPDIATL